MPNTKHLLLNFSCFPGLVNVNYHYKQIIHPVSARNIFLWYFLEHSRAEPGKKKKLPSIQRNKVSNRCFLLVETTSCIKILISLKSPLTNIERKYTLNVYYHITSYVNNTTFVYCCLFIKHFPLIITLAFPHPRMTVA